MAQPTDRTITVTINGVVHSVDMKKINDLHTRIMAGPGGPPGEKLAMAMAGNPLVTAGEDVPPDPESRGDYTPASS